MQIFAGWLLIILAHYLFRIGLGLSIKSYGGFHFAPEVLVDKFYADGAGNVFLYGFGWILSLFYFTLSYGLYLVAVFLFNFYNHLTRTKS